jgi:hypothetical protein
MRHSMLGLVTIMAASVLAPAAWAQTAPPAQSCHEQIKQLCSGVEPGGGRMKECVAAHTKDLTADCQQKIAAREQQAQTFKTACAADLKQYCADIVPGKGRELLCLKAHEPTVSQSCSAALSELPRWGHHGEHGAFKACKADVKSFCADVQPGGGRLIACLNNHAADVSPACKSTLASIPAPHASE